jgi:hypothetical protein
VRDEALDHRIERPILQRHDHDRARPIRQIDGQHFDRPPSRVEARDRAWKGGDETAGSEQADPQVNRKGHERYAATAVSISTLKLRLLVVDRRRRGRSMCKLPPRELSAPSFRQRSIFDDFTVVGPATLTPCLATTSSREAVTFVIRTEKRRAIDADGNPLALRALIVPNVRRQLGRAAELSKPYLPASPAL